MLAEPKVDEVADGRLRRLLAHWLAIRGDRLLPRRRDLDPSAIAPVLPIIWVLDHVPGGDRFRYRLAGEEINRIFGCSLRGRCLDEILGGPALRAAHRRVTTVIEQRMIAHCTGLVYLRQDRTGLGERLILPLADDGEHATGTVGATAYDSTEGAIPVVPRPGLVERFVQIGASALDAADPPF